MLRTLSLGLILISSIFNACCYAAPIAMLHIDNKTRGMSGSSVSIHVNKDTIGLCAISSNYCPADIFVSIELNTMVTLDVFDYNFGGIFPRIDESCRNRHISVSTRDLKTFVIKGTPSNTVDSDTVIRCDFESLT